MTAVQWPKQECDLRLKRTTNALKLRVASQNQGESHCTDGGGTHPCYVYVVRAELGPVPPPLSWLEVSPRLTKVATIKKRTSILNSLDTGIFSWILD